MRRRRGLPRWARCCVIRYMRVWVYRADEMVWPFGEVWGGGHVRRAVRGVLAAPLYLVH
jgi:hypothetical protein